MVTTWNKFCFTTGYVEVSISLPGQANTAGLWPGEPPTNYIAIKLTINFFQAHGHWEIQFVFSTNVYQKLFTNLLRRVGQVTEQQQMVLGRILMPPATLAPLKTKL